jgi:hypothetical protein
MPVDMLVPNPELRKVNTQILSDLGWLQGTFHVPQHQALMDFFASGVHLMKCTRVRLPGQKELIPFLAIRREMVALVQPTLPDELVEAPGSIGRTMPRKVECFLLQGQLRGNLEVLVNVRVSDYLRQQPNLLVLRECVFHPYGVAADSAQIRRMPLAIVNTARALGVAEHDAAQ